MFDNLSNRLEGIVKKIRGRGRLAEADDGFGQFVGEVGVDR